MSEPQTQPGAAGRGSSLTAAAVGVVCGLLWLGLAFWMIPSDRLSSPGGIASVVLPLLLIGLAIRMARSLHLLRDEAANLRRDLDALRDATPADATPFRDPEPTPAAGTADTAASKQPSQAVSAPVASQPPQGTLALEPRQADRAPLTIDELISALQFPETPDDTEGFRALRRAMQDHRTSLVVRAAQDVLTLLSQDGIYMDDLQPDRVHPDLWRRFISGERGGPVAEIGGVRDPDALEVTAQRLRENAVFRDAVHHFVRRFDRQLRDIEPGMSDEQLALLTDTRSARAFMLLGRAMGVFG